MDPLKDLEQFCLSRGAEIYQDYQDRSFRIRYKNYNMRISMEMLYEYNKYGDNPFIQEVYKQFEQIDEQEYAERFRIDSIDITAYGDTVRQSAVTTRGQVTKTPIQKAPVAVKKLVEPKEPSIKQKRIKNILDDCGI